MYNLIYFTAIDEKKIKGKKEYFCLNQDDFNVINWCKKNNLDFIKEISKDEFYRFDLILSSYLNKRKFKNNSLFELKKELTKKD